MTRRRILAFIAASFALVAALLLFPDRMIAPGRLKDAHASLNGNCFACHEMFRGASSQKCRSCHATDRRATPFHQALSEKDCLACHSDHEGMKAYRAPARFSHDLIEPGAKEQCASCHKKPDDALHGKVTQACSQCHTQTKWRETTFDHATFFALDANHDAPCATCHTGANFETHSCFGCHAHRRDKTVAFHRKRGVRNIDNCVACHRGGHGKAR